MRVEEEQLRRASYKPMRSLKAYLSLLDVNSPIKAAQVVNEKRDFASCRRESWLQDGRLRVGCGLRPLVKDYEL